MPYKTRNNVINFFDDYSLIVFKARHEETKGTGIKILTPKLMLQRLPIPLVQIKAVNNLENLLNRIR